MVVNERIEIKIEHSLLLLFLYAWCLIYALVCLIANELLP